MQKYFRVFKFAVTGICGLAVDTGVLWLLTNQMSKGYTFEYIIAPVLSFESAVINNYTISYLWVWKDRTKCSMRDYLSRFPTYNLTTLTAFSIKMFILLKTERIFKLEVIYCNIAAVLIASLINYIAGDLLIFRTKGSDKDLSS